uniref:Uncharacterized protein n=1 Tax=Anguilla anguilla TaxID=7936 RepID=A0A0E9UAQ3_ANGAN
MSLTPFRCRCAVICNIQVCSN